MRNKGHGRIEIRAIRTSTLLNDYTGFPHVGQVFRIDRTRADLSGQLKSKETVYGVTSLLPSEAPPDHLMAITRGHWKIENQLHWVRDVTFGEDKSQIRTKSGPRVFAILRNLVISVLRLIRCDNIAAGLRDLAWGGTEEALALIGC
ncbi:MAG: ISAs1 family transposase [Firmicutes bacterium]|nr:ISAs1 family transposase [Bacillota bacterium]